MIRFILKRSIQDNYSGIKSEIFRTFEAEVHELEDQLTRGGWGESGHDLTELIGVEVIKTTLPDAPEGE